MGEFKKVIFGIDLNYFSKEALDFTIEFVRSHNSKLVVIFAHQSIMPIVSASLPKSIIKKSIEGFDHSLKELCEENIPEDIDWEAVVLEGKTVYEKIIEAATKLSADLIILGEHDRHGLDNILLGHNTEKIVRYAACSVFVYKAN